MDSNRFKINLVAMQRGNSQISIESIKDSQSDEERKKSQQLKIVSHNRRLTANNYEIQDQFRFEVGDQMVEGKGFTSRK